MPSDDGLLRAGIAKVDISPVVGIQITQNHVAVRIGNHFCRDECTLFSA